jgi:hypothetical protein
MGGVGAAILVVVVEGIMKHAAVKLVRAPSEHALGGRVHERDPPFAVHHEKGFGDILRNRPVDPLAHREGLGASAQLDLRHGGARQRSQHLALLTRNPVRARLVVEHAYRAERQARRGLQKRTGVEAEMRRARDQGIAAEARVLGGVGHDEKMAL